MISMFEILVLGMAVGLFMGRRSNADANCNIIIIRQLRRLRRSLDSDSLATLVYTPL